MTQKAEPLMTLVISLLAPIFLGITNGDVSLARAAAVEAINDYRTKNGVSLIAAAQILTHGLASIGALILALDEKTPVLMSLRLRASANACCRSAEQNRRALQAAQTQAEAEESEAFHDAIFADRDPDPAPKPDPEVFLTPAAEQLLAAEAEARPHNNPVGQPRTQPKPEPFLTPAAEQLLAAEAEARLHNNPVGQPKTKTPTTNQQVWAIAMQREAGKINAAIAHLPPAQRPAASLRATALSTTAHSILGAAALPKPPADLPKTAAAPPKTEPKQTSRPA